MRALIDRPLPDGRYIAVHHDSIWVVESDGAILEYIAFPDGLPRPIAISDSGDVFFLSGHALSVWRRAHPAAGLQALFSLPEVPAQNSWSRPSFSVSRDGSHLVRCSTARVDAWRIADQHHLSVPCPDPGPMGSHGARLSPSGRWLMVCIMVGAQSGSDIGGYTVYATETGEEVISTSETDTFDVCFGSDDCTMLVVLDYGEPRIRRRFDLDARRWRDARPGEPALHRDPVHEQWMSSFLERLRRSQLSGLLAVSDDGRHLTNGEVLLERETGAAHDLPPEQWKAVAFSKDQLLLISAAGTLQTCAPGTVEAQDHTSLAEQSRYAALSPDGRSAALVPGRSDVVRVQQTHGPHAILATLPDRARSLKGFVHAGRTVATASTWQVAVTQLSDSTASTETIDLATVGVPTGISGLAVTRCGSVVAACTKSVEAGDAWRAAVLLIGADGSVADPLWLTSAREQSRCVAVWGDDHRSALVAIGQHDTVEVWQAQQRLHVFRGGHRGGAGAVCFSADGGTLYSRGLDTTIVAWSLR